ncbi:MAG: hypothetical protein Q8P95_01700 [bacterium]|nr:hypothetical protein [bacterium]
MEWLTPAYLSLPKSKGWYALMSLIVLGFVMYGMLTGAYVISVTFLILAGVSYWHQTQRVPVVKVEISDIGVRFGSKYYPYDQIKSFWIFRESEPHLLNLSLYKGVQRDLSIILPEEIDSAHLREYLLLQIQEETGKRESFSDQLIRNLGL